MQPIEWIIIIAVIIVVIILIARALRPRPGADDTGKPQFGRLDKALQKDAVHRQTGEFTIAIDLSDVDMMIDNEDFEMAEERVRECLRDAEERRDTSTIANMMGYLEKITLAKKRRF